MSAAAIAAALGGARRSGRGWLVRCPAHDDHNPSCSLADGENGKLLVKCWAGCDSRDVLAALRERGLLAGNPVAAHIRHQQAENTKTDAQKYTARIEIALRWWRASRPAADSPVATYLRGRGITLSLLPMLRYHPALRHPDGGNWPAMVALVRHGVDNRPIGIHRTFLARDGSGKAAVSPNKMMLGNVGGGAVRFAPVSEKLAVCEGLETALSVQQATGIPTWAALSAGGIESLLLPPLPLASDIIIAADHDENGVGQRAAEHAAQRWVAEERRVRIALPPRVGQDFNDVLQEGL